MAGSTFALYYFYEDGAVTTDQELKTAFEEVNGFSTFKKIQNKLAGALATAMIMYCIIIII